MRRRRAHDKEVRRLSLVSPPGMVAVVAERRTAGDWRGACAAALTDVHVDLSDVTRRWGAVEASRIEAELHGLAPDLLRRFLPRLDSLALTPGQQVVLSRLAGPLPTRARVAPVLVVSLPSGATAPQRLELRVADAVEVGAGWLDLPDWCWHADAVVARRWAYGGSPERLPWHHPDGRPFGPDETSPDRPTDRAGEVERLAALLDAGDTVAAFETAGLAVDRTPPRLSYGGTDLVARHLAWLARTLPVLLAESRRLAHRYRRRSLRTTTALFGLNVGRGGTVTVHAGSSVHQWDGPLVGVPAPSDVALLRSGALTADELHPLVHEALLPGRIQRRRASDAGGQTEFRVRCGGDWHVLRLLGGRLLTERHDEAEIERELLLAGLGGSVAGCAAAVRAWRTGARPVPKEIRRMRADLLARAFHGDTDTVLALLAQGLDPELRDGTGGSLLHRLCHLDHVRALPALLAAGLRVDEPDGEGATPLHRAAAAGRTDVMAALVAAGADERAVDGRGRTPRRLLQQARRHG